MAKAATAKASSKSAAMPKAKPKAKRKSRGVSKVGRADMSEMTTTTVHLKTENIDLLRLVAWRRQAKARVGRPSVSAVLDGLIDAARPPGERACPAGQTRLMASSSRRRAFDLDPRTCERLTIATFRGSTGKAARAETPTSGGCGRRPVRWQRCCR
jgi:hypothetical protein